MDKYRFKLRDLTEAAEGVALIGVTVAFSHFLKSWYRNWGITDVEAGQKIPQDDLVPNPKMISTRGITIKAPASRIWPLLMQFGLKRGGWYSYDLLEYIGGAAEFVDGHSARRVIPELQDLKVGDKIWMHPRIMPLTVKTIDSPKSVVFLTRADLKNQSYFEINDHLPEQYVNSNWVFCLNSHGNDTRLIVRSRLDYNPNWINTIAWRVFSDPISFVMERKMLLTIKRIAEASG